MPVRHQLLDLLDHLRDVLGGTGEMIWWQPVQRRHLGQERVQVAVAELEIVLADLARPSQHVVVDISHVLDGDHAMAEEPQVTAQDVEAQVGERMPQVAGVIWGHPAHVQPHRAGADGSERHEFATTSIEQAQGHGRDSRRC
jgi:hypothetical protein